MAGTVIVGGGHAGGAAAAALRRYGYDAPITILSEEAHAPYERPPLSKGFLRSVDDTPPPIAKDWQSLSVDLHLKTRTIAILRDEAKVSCASGALWAYDHLILATGGALRRLPFGVSNKLYYLRNIPDAEKLRAALKTSKRMIVIGAGVIGLEVAAAARQTGLNVTLLEAADRVLSRNVASDLAVDVAEMHIDHGVEIRCGALISDVREKDAEISIILKGGEEILSDIVVAGIGITPAVELAQMAALSCENGVLVNDKQQTDDPNIYAIGDLAAVSRNGESPLRLETWANAIESAEIAAAAICGVEPPRRRAPWFWTDQYDCNIQVAGNTLNADRVIVRGARAASTRLYFEGETLVGAATINNGKDMGAFRRMLDGKWSPAIEDAADEAKSVRELLKACKR